MLQNKAGLGTRPGSCFLGQETELRKAGQVGLE